MKVENINRDFLLSKKGCDLDAQILTIIVGIGCAYFVQLFFVLSKKGQGKPKKDGEIT